MTTLADEEEVHPDALVTVKVYVPVGSPEIFMLVPDPVVVVLPGFLVIVHVPVDGRSFNTALPVATVQLG